MFRAIPDQPPGPPDPASTSRIPWDRLRVAISDDFGNLQPRLLLASLLVSPLPRLSLNRWRTLVYRAAGVQVGPGTVIMDRMHLSGAGNVLARLHIGRRCVINGPFFADLTAPITIGDRASVGHHAVLVTAGHTLGGAGFRAGEVDPAPITIGEGVLIGARVTILPGVTIGPGAVIAAGSVVAGDIPANKLAGGNPARVVKALSEEP